VAPPPAPAGPGRLARGRGADHLVTERASLSPTEIIMADSGGLDKDSASAISGGAFSNTWLRST
jgi:hypothetical protein